MSEPILLEVFEDFACPWCFLGRRRLFRALDSLDAKGAFRVVHRAYQLRPDLPEGGIDLDAYLVPKVGSKAKLEAMHQHMARLGAAENIRFDFSPGSRMFNMRLAHRVAEICAKEGAGREAADALFRGSFEERVPMDQLQALLALLVAHDVPVLPGDIERRIHLSEAEEEVDRDLSRGRELGIQGVPFFLAGGRLAMSGAQEFQTFSEYLASAMRGSA